MSQLNDCQYAAMVSLGIPATQHNDMLLLWAQQNGATSPCLNDAIYEMLLLQGATPGVINDMWYEVLFDLGYVGALNDMLLDFWCNGGGSFSIVPIEGWTDGGCGPLCEIPLSRFTIVTKSRLFGGGTFHLHSMDWSDDGMYMYAGLLVHNQVRNFKSSGNPWEIDELAGSDFMRPDDLSNVYDNAPGVRVKPDGTELWVNAYTGLNNGHTLSYSLPEPYEWTETGPNQPVLINSFNNSRAEFNHLEDLNINPDGTKIISPGNDAGSFPYQLNMTAWDGSTLAYGPDNQTIDASNCWIPKSGTCMYKSTGRVINKYAFGSPWELATLGSTIVDSLDLTALIAASIQTIFITEDRLFVTDEGDVVYQFNASDDYIVKFSKVVYWGVTDGVQGVKFINTDTLDTGTAVSVAEASGTSDTLSYTVTWGSAPPAVGETIVFDYEAAPPDGTGAGVYEDEDGERMQSTTMPMTNCAVQEPIATFIAEFITGSATPLGLSPVGTYSYSRNDTASTVTDFEGLGKTELVNELGFDGQRRVEDLSTGLGTQSITVVVGSEYQLTIQGGNGDTAQITAGVSGTPTLTADGSNRISWPNGIPITATATTITVTVTGTLTELLFEDVTGQSVQVPSEQIVGTSHGTNVANVMYKNYANGGSVSAGGVVTDSAGAAFAIGTVNKGANAWEARTNQATYNEDFTNGAWGGQGRTIDSDATTPPRQRGNADRLNVTTANSKHGISQSLAVTAGNNNAASVYVKDDGARYAYVGMITASKWITAVFDLTTETFTDIDVVGAGTILAGTYSESLGDGWYRIGVAGLITVEVTQFCVFGSAGSATPPTYANGQPVFTAVEGEDLFVSLAQFERDVTFISPAIPTSGSSATRNADDLNYNPGNYVETGGCLLDFIVTADQLNNFAAVPTIFTIAKALFGDYVTAYIKDATTVTIDFVTVAGGGASTADFTVAAGNRYKIAFTWDKVSGTIRASMNGAPAFDFTGASADDILLTADAATFEVGKFNDIQFFNGNILDIRLTKELVSDSILESASTL